MMSQQVHIIYDGPTNEKGEQNDISSESVERREAFHESLFQMNKDLIQNIFQVPQNKSLKLKKSSPVYEKDLPRSLSEVATQKFSPPLSRREFHRSCSACPSSSVRSSSSVSPSSSVGSSSSDLNKVSSDPNKVLPKFLAKSSLSKSQSAPLLAPPHQFAIHTYHTATKCDECGNFMVGVQRQGLNCRSCGMNVHAICRRLIDNTRRPCRVPGATTPKKTTFSLGKFLM